jgi:hypothetical protein
MYSVVVRRQCAVQDGHDNISRMVVVVAVQVAFSFHPPIPGFLFDMTPSADQSLLIGVDVYAYLLVQVNLIVNL